MSPTRIMTSLRRQLVNFTTYALYVHKIKFTLIFIRSNVIQDSKTAPYKNICIVM